ATRVRSSPRRGSSSARKSVTNPRAGCFLRSLVSLVHKFGLGTHGSKLCFVGVGPSAKPSFAKARSQTEFGDERKKDLSSPATRHPPPATQVGVNSSADSSPCHDIQVGTRTGATMKHTHRLAGVIVGCVGCVTL